MTRIKRRLTYADVVSSIALFLVLGGGAAIAADHLAKNSVGSKQLKRNAVTTAKIKNNAVTGAKVRAGSLQAADFAAGQIPAGPKGATGPTFGATGEGACGQLEDPFAVCVSTGSVNLPTSGHVLLVASAEWDNDDTAAPNSGECRLSADGSPAGPTFTFGENTSTHGVDKGGTVALNTVTGTLSAGNHRFELECREEEPSVFNGEATISAVLLGS